MQGTCSLFWCEFILSRASFIQVEVPSTVDAHTEGGAPNIYNSVVSAQPLPSNDKNDQTVPILED